MDPYEAVIEGTRATTRILNSVAIERGRQDSLWGEQNHLDGTNVNYALNAAIEKHFTEAAASSGQLTWRHILVEEVYEALAETDPAKLREELIQVAAVAVSWVEAIDRRT